jgi:hypothetical protein
VTEHELVVVAPTCASAQLVPGLENAPAPLELKLTVPVGKIAPTPESDTVAVQTVPAPTATGFGRQTTLVVVDRRALTVRRNVSWLVRWMAVWANVPVIVCEPPALGVNVTWQAAWSVVAGTFDNVQLLPGRLKAPAPELVKFTVPVGFDLVPADDVSVTVAVQIVGVPADRLLGAQTTSVDVGRRVTVTLNGELVLEACAPEIRYVAVIACVPLPRAVGV